MESAHRVDLWTLRGILCMLLFDANFKFICKEVVNVNSFSIHFFFNVCVYTVLLNAVNRDCRLTF